MVSSRSGIVGLTFLFALAGCGQGADAPEGATKSAASAGSGAQCAFESTKDGSPLLIKAVATDTPQAKEFLQTCINPYTKLYVADAEAAKEGKKKFGYYSCTQCHGGNAGGQTGPSIIDERWQYAKHVTDKGLFETIAGGTNLGMMGWHQQVTNNPEMVPTDDILKMIGWLRASYQGAGETPWLN
jgi:cytochrome c-L